MQSLEHIRERVLSWAEAGLKLTIPISASCALIPGGRNGPYLDIESPVRNTSHWLVTFSIAYEASGDKRFGDAAHRLAGFLLHDNQYAIGDVLVHRQRDAKDWCNGVIGPAWVIEALSVYASVFDSREADEKAGRLLDQLQFDCKTGAWIGFDPMQGRTRVDRTYNHQSWLAAARAEALGGDDPQVQRFLDASSERSFRVGHEGLIYHRMPLPRITPANVGAYTRSAARRAGLGAYRRGLLPFALGTTERALGYQLYVLYSFARLRLAVRKHPLFRSTRLKKALGLVASKDFLDSLTENPFAYGYNAPGFELPLVCVAFSNIEPRLTLTETDRALETQVANTYEPETGLFTNNTYDPLTLSARLYELALALRLTSGTPTADAPTTPNVPDQS